MISTCTRCKQMHEFTTEEADRPDRMCKLCCAATAADEFSALIRERLGFRGSNYTCPNRKRQTLPNGNEVLCAAVDGEWAIDRKNHPPEGQPYRCTGCDQTIMFLRAEEKELHRPARVDPPEPIADTRLHMAGPETEATVKEATAEIPQSEEPEETVNAALAMDALSHCTNLVATVAAHLTSDLVEGMNKSGDMIRRVFAAAPAPDQTDLFAAVDTRGNGA